MVDRELRGGNWELVRQTTRQIEFSDAFKTKIGSSPVRAAIIIHVSCHIVSLDREYRLHVY